jgi:hypothetical protein
MPDVPQRLSQPKLLIGEGREDVLFFTAFLKHLHLNDVQIADYGGKYQLRSYLRALLLRPDFTQLVSLGIVRDADTDATSAFQSVSGALHDLGLPVPDIPGQVAGVTVRVGVWIMPDGQGPGMLEDLCLAAVQNDLAMPCVDDYFMCLFHNSQNQPNNLAKARVHAWLASRIEPDLRLGEAAAKGYWPWDSAAFEPIKTFLQAL